MHACTKTRQISRRYNSTTMAPIDNALAHIGSLKPGDKLCYQTIADDYGVERSTLSRRHRAISQPPTTKNINQQKLDPQQEQELVKYIQGLTARHLSPTRDMIQNFASTIAKEPVSESWVTRFINRHSIHLISQWVTGMDANRHNADSGHKYKLYFDLLQQKISKYNVELRHTYNMDEKGFMIGIIGRSKRVFSRRQWKKKEVRTSFQDGNREWITLMACVCADGEALPPGLIYQAASKQVRSSWVEDIEVGKHTAFITTSPSGWTNNDIGLAWLEQVFDRYTKKKARQSYRLLIVDGHGSHLTMDFIDYCDNNKILLAIYPPHSTHTLQPLDVAMFKPLSTAYSKMLSTHLHRSHGLLPIKKDDFFPLFWDAWATSFKKSTILSSFKATGIAPFNPDVILERFRNNTPEASESGESSTSCFSGEDWRKMERLVRSEVRDQGSKAVKKLSRSLHHISVQNELLHFEVAGLREALSTKKKHNKKRKPLDLQQRQEYHGGAVFWSPSRVREARHRNTVIEQEKKQLELQKADTKKLKEAHKLYKEKIAEEKRVQRAEAQRIKEKEKADAAVERARQKDVRNAEKALLLSQERKRKALRPSTQSNKRRKCVVDTGDSKGAPKTVSAPPPVTTRCGRNINLPSKYR